MNSKQIETEQRIITPQEAREALAQSVIAALTLISEWGHGEDCRYDEGEAKCYCQRLDMLNHLRAISAGVATEPERIAAAERAAVVRELAMFRQRSKSESDYDRFDERIQHLENGGGL